ncbi:putative leader peptide [Prauserella oleivorans]|uniref:Leader peptide n=1 Tax=Prauserella oleivorans TaxID=1478153 RepID=A0ABW5WDH3_9PSEU
MGRQPVAPVSTPLVQRRHIDLLRVNSAFCRRG